MPSRNRRFTDTSPGVMDLLLLVRVVARPVEIDVAGLVPVLLTLVLLMLLADERPLVASLECAHGHALDAGSLSTCADVLAAKLRRTRENAYVTLSSHGAVTVWHPCSASKACGSADLASVPRRFSRWSSARARP